MTILSKLKTPTDEYAAARARAQQIDTQRQAQWAAFQRCLEQADELRAERADLLLHGDQVSLIRNSESTEEALQRGQVAYADYAALAPAQLAAEAAVRGAIGRRAPDRVRDIADEYAAHVERIRDLAEAARAEADAMGELEAEAETLYKTHGATIPAIALGGGAVSLRSTLEVHLIEPLQRYADAVTRDREQAEFEAHANSKWGLDRVRLRAQWTGDQDAFGVESPAFPDASVSWTEVTDEQGRRRLYTEDKP
jgi:hypothetical protein